MTYSSTMVINERERERERERESLPINEGGEA